MSDTYRQAYVYIQDDLAGKLKETDKGYCFEYTQEYLRSAAPVPVSINMPLTENPYESAILFPFFDGLIPEGWLLDIASRNWKLEKNDRFGLLLLCCKDCIGDISVMEVEDVV